MEVNLGKELFRFDSFLRWVNTAANLFRNIGLKDGYGYVCVDAAGRICQSGREFRRANEEGTFPIVVYSTEAEKPDAINCSVLSCPDCGKEAEQLGGFVECPDCRTKWQR